MLVKALITGIENIKSKPGAEKTFDFHKVNFIDTENPSGSPQEMSLPRDPSELANALSRFNAARMKIVNINVFQNGSYANFGGFPA